MNFIVKLVLCTPHPCDHSTDCCQLITYSSDLLVSSLVSRCSSVVRTASQTFPGSGVTIALASETWRTSSGSVRL